MSGYIEAGYVVVLGGLAAYGSSLLLRERAARRRGGALPGAVASRPADKTGRSVAGADAPEALGGSAADRARP